ncbi:MAG: sulfotransferase domain-containing protein, partial [Synechococcales cyanobacterium CRU_2_2]|nr:sulfotransferase domain-containing protein [Synechococcales cyanobacterium CRU_2_2]
RNTTPVQTAHPTQTSPSQTSPRQTSPSQTSPGSQAERRGPDFIIIGAEKCGTSSLYHYLRRHPAMLPPIEKEIDFFDVEYDRGLDWYLAHFPPMPQQPGWVTGETSPNYLYSDLAPERVHRHFPQTKLIVILRNPVDRTVSRFNMMVRNGTEKRSFEVAIAEELSQIQPEIDRDGEALRPSVLNWHRHIGNSLYYYHLKRWLDYFPESNSWS